MIAIQPNDICYSTALNGHNPFNTDGVERTELDPTFARQALDFRILKKQSYDHAGRAIPKHYHLVKDTDDSFIPCISIGEQFTPIQHLDVYDYIVQKVMPQVPQMKLEMVGTIHGGGVGLIAAKWGDTFAVKGDKSENMMRLFFSNPSNGKGRMVLGFTTVRVVCQNTLLAATQEAAAEGFKITHTKSAEKLAFDAIKCIESQAIAALEMKRRCERLGEIGVDSATVARALDMIYPMYNIPTDSPTRARLEHVRARVLEEFEAGETARTMGAEKTAWRLLNSVTYPIFHPDKISKRMDTAEIAYKGMVGSVAGKTARALEIVERVVA